MPGSLRVSPLAIADAYNATKDVTLNIPAPGVLTNDTGTPAPTAQPIAAGATAQGGAVTLGADGSFNYTPPAGFEGSDTFTTATTADAERHGDRDHQRGTRPAVTTTTPPTARPMSRRTPTSPSPHRAGQRHDRLVSVECPGARPRPSR